MKFEECERDFKGIWFPREVWLDDRLTALDKIILLEIDSLSGEHGCYATNEYLAQFCKCSVSKVSNTISTLIKLNYIYLDSFNGRERILKSRLIKNERQTYKIYKADLQNLEQSNIIDNNIENNKENIIRESFDEPKTDSEDNQRITPSLDTSTLPTSSIKCQSGTLTQNTQSTNNSTIRSTKPKNVICIKLELVLDSIKKLYHKYGYGRKFTKKATGIRLLRLVNNKKAGERMNPTEIVLAYAAYLSSCYNEGKEVEYIKESGTFLTERVYDYVEVVKKMAQLKLEEKYGEQWDKLRFELVEGESEQ